MIWSSEAPFGESPVCRLNCRTSLKSSIGSCVLSAWCSSACGPEGRLEDAQISLLELAALAETAGSQVLEGVIQRRDKPSAATFIGSGKARELRDIIVATGADTVICDGELTPGQLRQLEEIVKVKVVDRTWLILDIFAQHAQSREGKAQVALAQMQYLLPRCEAGVSPCHASAVVAWPEAEVSALADLAKPRLRPTDVESTARSPAASRAQGHGDRAPNQTGTATPQPDPGGCDRGVHQRRKVELAQSGSPARGRPRRQLPVRHVGSDSSTQPSQPDGRVFTLSDTVGFVRHLPHQLVEAFRSTWKRLPTQTSSSMSSTGPIPIRRLSCRQCESFWTRLVRATFLRSSPSTRQTSLTRSR